MNREVDALNGELEEVKPKGDDCGEAVVPNNDTGAAEVAGVEKRDGVVVGADGVEKILPVEADTAAGGVAVETAGAAKLATALLIGAAACGTAGKCKVGCTLRAAASCLAVSRRSASRKGSFPSPRRRWSARYAVFMDSMY